MSTTYRVVVTREGDDWLADVPALRGAHTFARNLESLDRYVREVIVLAAGLPNDAAGSLGLDWELHTGDEPVTGRKFTLGPDDDTPVTLPDGTVLDGEAAEAFARAKISEAGRRAHGRP